MSKQVGEYDDFVRAEILAARVAELEDVLRSLAWATSDHIKAGTVQCEVCRDSVIRARRLLSDTEDSDE